MGKDDDAANIYALFRTLRVCCMKWRKDHCGPSNRGSAVSRTAKTKKKQEEIMRLTEERVIMNEERRTEKEERINDKEERRNKKEKQKKEMRNNKE